MSRTFIVISESATVVADCDGCHLELDEMGGTPRCGVRTAQDAVPTLKNRIKRVLRKHVLDVRDEQFLMLLFMMNAQNKDRLDFVQQLFVSIGKEIINMRIDGCAVALCFLHCWAGDQSAQIASMHIASGIVVRIKKVSILRNFGPISREELFQDKRFKKPGGMGQVPLSRA